MTRIKVLPPERKLTAYGVRANCRWRASDPMGPSLSWGTTISQASPESWTLLVSKRNTMRSALPGASSVTSVRLKHQFGPSIFSMWRSALRLSLASCTATTSNLETISAMHSRECRSRLGESSSADSRFSVRSPKARTFQVAIRRFQSRPWRGSPRPERNAAGAGPPKRPRVVVRQS